MQNKSILISGFLLLILVIITFIFLQKDDKSIYLKEQKIIKKSDINTINAIYSSTGEVQHSQASDIE